MSSPINYNTEPSTQPSTPPGSMDLIARYGWEGTPDMYNPPSLAGYHTLEIHEEFYERFPVLPLSMGYNQIHPMSSNPGTPGYTSPNSPMPWRDQVASNAPDGWGSDAPVWGLPEFDVPLYGYTRSYAPSPLSLTSTTEQEVDEWGLFSSDEGIDPISPSYQAPITHWGQTQEEANYLMHQWGTPVPLSGELPSHRPRPYSITNVPSVFQRGIDLNQQMNRVLEAFSTIENASDIDQRLREILDDIRGTDQA
ncbi:hypothetical protein RSOLAG1IB_11841 [Rhizoctonia solani AG-1 IB]|uniref:Uncharacterized protein n=1 Tax=Thanatephorus cucumeris (strain AG1-IB / isolate 7/3/14) TaxID=1108050 RepID=A0A0B7FDQ6_THACB|nr:hypothetical protein RSOLAG1IB_11841 [Rhizoctonia solani AG-1 IB]